MKTEAKERPILFSGEMVRALLREENPKTQTRRAVKPQPDPEMVREGVLFRNPSKLRSYIGEIEKIPCPYGQPGDRLWVREAFCQGADEVIYRATEKSLVVTDDGDGFQILNKDGTCKSPWKPSIHMPRAASRITLEVVTVRVERLQEISEEDALAEGIIYQKPTAEDIEDGATDGVYIVPGLTQPLGQPMWAPTAALAYRFLWESINGPASWDANPWVWVVEFKRNTSKEARP